MKGLKFAVSLALAILVSSGAAFAQAHDPMKTGTLRIGFIPAEDSRAMVRQSQAILDIVAKNTGMKVEAFVGSDYNATIEAFRSGHVDVGLLGPFSYVLATTVAPVEAFAVTVVAKTMQPSYKSIIIARKDSPIKDLASIKGHTFAFVDPGSTSGSMVPSAAFVKAGITPQKDFKQVMYSGGHDATIVAVGSGKVDAGSVADRIYERGCAKGLADCSKLKIVWTSPPIPNDPLLYRKNLPEELKKKIREAFYSVKNLPFGEMGTVARFDPATDKDYDPIREIATALKLDLKKMK
ncbi:MAG: phosphonate ABC transporter substrate-binding protein [Rhodospirillales bacterium RIFCSPLOWO2_01_FULL_65_14]|nr:MAG: phosphonate ABC transporter substrate-binding protein [Rhodospirillales bacterium RIFCSPLOWO2_01_FULL_65_14]